MTEVLSRDDRLSGNEEYDDVIIIANDPRCCTLRTRTPAGVAVGWGNALWGGGGAGGRRKGNTMTPILSPTEASGSTPTSTSTYTYILPPLSSGGVLSCSPSSSSSLEASLGERPLISIGRRELGRSRGVPLSPPPPCPCPLVLLHRYLLS